MATLLVVTACDSKPPAEAETPPLNEALPTIPLPPDATFISRQGSTDALQLSFRSTMSAEGVARFYRDMLSRPGFRLISDTEDSTGAIAIFAEGEKRPLWVRIKPAGSGSLVDLTGAVTGRDSSYAERQQAARDSSNRLVPR